MPVPSSYGGIVPPLCTPMTSDRAIDRASLRRLIDAQIEAGVHGLFILGSTGEMAALTDAERDEVIDTTVQHVAGRIPVLAGTIAMATNQVIAQAKRAAELGADAIVACGPYYIRPNQAEIIAHFHAVRDAIDLPIFAYDVPPNVQTTLAAETVAALGEDGTIVGLKDSSGNEPNFRTVLALTEAIEGFSVFTGSELTVDYALLAGAHGCVPGLGNVDPAGYVRLYDLAMAGDWTAAREEQKRLTRLFRIIAQATPGRVGFTAGALGGFKTALRELGVIATNQVAMPMMALDDEEATRVRTVLEESGLLG